jgi:predicted phosphodiesterase
MRIGLICDIHEDIRSLKAALRQLEKRNCNELICLGDIVGYDISCHEPGQSRNPSACIAAVSSNCRHIVVGNHDLFAIKKIPTSTHAFEFPRNWYRMTIDERRANSGHKVWLYETESSSTILNKRDRNYLDSLPENLILKFSNMPLHFSHSYHPDVTGSLMLRPHNPWELRHHMQILKNQGCLYGFSGHMHPNGITIGKDNEIRENPFGKIKFESNQTQYFCPSISNSGQKQGYTIVDFTEMTIETFRIAENKNRRETWYERIFKKS